MFNYSSGAIGTRLRYGLASVIALVVAFGVIVVPASPAQAEEYYPYSDGCFYFNYDIGLYCLEWTGGYPYGYVRARVPAAPRKESVGLFECTNCGYGQYGHQVWTLVAATYGGHMAPNQSEPSGWQVFSIPSMFPVSTGRRMELPSTLHLPW